MAREFITFLGGAVATCPFAHAHSNRADAMHRRADGNCWPECAVLRDGVSGCAHKAWVGRRKKSPDRSSMGCGDADKFRSFAKELVDLRPDAIVGQSTPVVVALVRETQTIPIVFLNVADPIGSGFVVSLARPGGNLTGFMTDNSALGGKWVELLKEIAPRTVRVALMFNPTTAVPLKFYMPSIQAAPSTSALR